MLFGDARFEDELRSMPGMGIAIASAYGWRFVRNVRNALSSCALDAVALELIRDSSLWSAVRRRVTPATSALQTGTAWSVYHATGARVRQLLWVPKTRRNHKLADWLPCHHAACR